MSLSPVVRHPDVYRALVVDEAHRSYVNWEVFFFSSKKAKQTFEANPLDYCGIVTDPVSAVRFRPTKDSPMLEYEGRDYFFQTAENRANFEEMPEALANPMYKMTPKTSQ